MKRPGLFVTGTDTGVGKTTITASILRRLAIEGVSVGVMKPLATGSTEDAERLLGALGADVPLARISPIVFETPAAPSVAARLGRKVLPFETLLETIRSCWDWWEGQGRAEMLVEGVGGLLCPITERETLADLAIALDLPLLIVARRALGTLNHTLLTVEAARNRGLRIAGLVLIATEPPGNPVVDDQNPGELMRFLEDVPVLADVPYTMLPLEIDECVTGVDWRSLLKPDRGDRFRSVRGVHGECLGS